MTTVGWNTLYEELESGTVAGVPTDTYTVEVEAARKRPQSRLLFLDLKIIQGPLTGKTIQVKLHVPRSGNKGAQFHFNRKSAGLLLDRKATFAKLEAVDPTEENIEAALDVLADAVIGVQAIAEVSLVVGGPYDGNNELEATRPLESQGLAAAAVLTATGHASPAPAPVPPAPDQSAAVSPTDVEF